MSRVESVHHLLCHVSQSRWSIWCSSAFRRWLFEECHATMQPIRAPRFLWLVECLSRCVQRQICLRVMAQIQRHQTNSQCWTVNQSDCSPSHLDRESWVTLFFYSCMFFLLNHPETKIIWTLQKIGGLNMRQFQSRCLSFHVLRWCQSMVALSVCPSRSSTSSSNPSYLSPPFSYSLLVSS